MRNFLPQSLISLANRLPAPLYVVGGSVRNHLAGFPQTNPDWDICAPLAAEKFAAIAGENGFCVKSVYKHTGTVKLQDTDGNDYEYSCFRSDKYVRGSHTPTEIFFTDDIALDARRRDFTCNAVYYDIAADQYADPLDGITAIQEKRLTTVAPAKKVFGEDGLRLMRLARQAAQLGFTPDKDTLNGAKANAELIKDISPERIFTELCLILQADQKYGVKNGHYTGIRLLEEIGVLAIIMPELTLGKNMAQRTDFHDHDVLEHSFRVLLYSHPSIRLAALLHDVGKPFCTLRDNNRYDHNLQGSRIARDILNRLKAPKKTIDRVCYLTEQHMYDLNCETRESKLRRYLVQHYEIMDELLLLKQADFSGCKDNLNPAPTVVRWKALLAQMKEEKVPFSLKELAVKGNDLIDLGIPPLSIAFVLQKLLEYTAINPQDNEKERLCKLALAFYKEKQAYHVRNE